MNLLPFELVREEEVSRAHLIAADRSLSWVMPAGAGPMQWPESGQVELGLRPKRSASSTRALSMHRRTRRSSTPRCVG